MMEYQWEEYVENLRKVCSNINVYSVKVGHLAIDVLIQSQVREIRAFQGNTAIFRNDELIGGADSFLQWAAYNYDYSDNM